MKNGGSMMGVENLDNRRCTLTYDNSDSYV